MSSTKEFIMPDYTAEEWSALLKTKPVFTRDAEGHRCSCVRLYNSPFCAPSAEEYYIQCKIFYEEYAHLLVPQNKKRCLYCFGTEVTNRWYDDWFCAKCYHQHIEWCSVN